MLFKIVCMLMIFFCSGCVPHSADVKVTPSMEQYFQMTTDEQVKKFRSYSLEEQYQLYLYGNQIMHPPAVYLSVPFAENGPVLVPFLKKKLETAKEDLTIRDIAFVCAQLAHSGLYNFAQDDEFMKLLEKRAHEMKNFWKDTALKDVVEIRKYSNPTNKVKGSVQTSLTIASLLLTGG